MAGRTWVGVLWSVDLTRPWMVGAGPLLAPAFAAAHAAMMRSGERGPARHLARSA